MALFRTYRKQVIVMFLSSPDCLFLPFPLNISESVVAFLWEAPVKRINMSSHVVVTQPVSPHYNGPDYSRTRLSFKLILTRGPWMSGCHAPHFLHLYNYSISNNLIRVKTYKPFHVLWSQSQAMDWSSGIVNVACDVFQFMQNPFHLILDLFWKFSW